MPTERDYLIGAMLGEAGNQDDRGMAMIGDVLWNRAYGANPYQYGTPQQGAPNSIQGQLFAYSGGNPQFSSADLSQAQREGSSAPNTRLMNAIYNPSALTGGDVDAYNRAARIADTFVDPSNPQYSYYRGSARGADYFDTGGNTWAAQQPWGGANSFTYGGHTFRGQSPLSGEWAPGYTSEAYNPQPVVYNQGGQTPTFAGGGGGWARDASGNLSFNGMILDGYGNWTPAGGSGGGQFGGGYGGTSPYPSTQFSGSPAASYNNPAFGTDFADPGLMNLAPNTYSSFGGGGGGAAPAAGGGWQTGPNGQLSFNGMVLDGYGNWTPAGGSGGGGGGGYPYGQGMSFGVGSPGFGGGAAPAATGYAYGSGMDYGQGDYGFGSNGGGMGYGYGFQSQPAATNFGQFGMGSSEGGHWSGGDDRSAGVWVPDSAAYSTAAPSAASLNGFGSGAGYGSGYGSFSDFGMGSNTGYQDPYTGAYSDGSDVANMVSAANNSLAVGAAANARAAADNAAWYTASNAGVNNMLASSAAYGQNQFDQNLSRMQTAYNPFSTQYQSY